MSVGAARHQKLGSVELTISNRKGHTYKEVTKKK